MFSIFYPLSIVLHIVGFGDLFDCILKDFITLNQSNIALKLQSSYLFIHIALSLLAIKIKKVTFILFGFSLYIFFDAFLAKSL